MMLIVALLTAWTVSGAGLLHSQASSDRLAVALCVWEKSQLGEALALAESIRSFGGSLSRAPILAYLLEGIGNPGATFVERSKTLGVELKTFSAPREASAFPFAAKIYAAARAEAELEATTDILAWLDPDTVIWRKPRAFLLEKGKSLGYRPVMHQLIGSSFDRPADAFWTRLYQTLGVEEKALFSMTTPVDRMTIRPYFNAGLLIVRPGRKLLRAWPEAFQKTASDKELLEMCRQDQRKMIFLHQAALAGALLAILPKEEMVELPETYNYPLNLHDAIPAERRLAGLDGLITLRYDEGARVAGFIKKSGLTGKMVDWLLARFPATGE